MHYKMRGMPVPTAGYSLRAFSPGLFPWLFPLGFSSPPRGRRKFSALKGFVFLLYRVPLAQVTGAAEQLPIIARRPEMLLLLVSWSAGRHRMAARKLTRPGGGGGANPRQPIQFAAGNTNAHSTHTHIIISGPISPGGSNPTTAASSKQASTHIFLHFPRCCCAVLRCSVLRQLCSHFCSLKMPPAERMLQQLCAKFFCPTLANDG
jgi:hypothetical protein